MTEDAQHWEQLQALFHLAEDTPEEDLDDLLQASCADPDLRRRARSLITTGRAGRYESAIPTGPPRPGGRVGPYTIIRHLGSGGIGVVYLVERRLGGSTQRSALKVLSQHAAGDFFVERFQREQHILASLDHPNITRLLDCGVSDHGESYLVMEYVAGTHLDTYCDDHAIGIRERLTLFLQVCEAVAYAHRNLTVHLDLKPSNILVAESGGIVKLLDFGTSKLIQPDELQTSTIMATPAYASPEQLRNEPVTTLCDVYSLGAVLFSLLSGRRPNHDSSVALIIERSMKELPPEPVTAAVTPAAAAKRGLTEARLRSLLTGDLATIVAKCLMPRPKDRYVTVDALLADLQRYLAGQPVLARPQTAIYRLGKFIRRNRAAVLTASLAALALAASLAYASWRQHEAVVAGRRALRMQEFTYGLFRLANSNYLGKPSFTVPEFLQMGVNVLPEFITNPSDQRVAQLSLAESLYDNEQIKTALPVFEHIIEAAKKDGDLNSEAEAEAYAGNIATTLGQRERGTALVTSALELSRQRAVTPSARVRIELYYTGTRFTSGVKSPEDAKLMKQAVEEAEREHLPERETAFAFITYAEYLGLSGKIDEGEVYLQRAKAIYDREPYAQCDRAEVDLDLAYVRDARQDLSGSAAWFQRSYQEVTACRGPEDKRTLITQGYLAGVMLKMGQASAVKSMLEASLPAWRRAFGSGPELYFVLYYLARASNQTGDFQRGKLVAQECLDDQTGKVADHSSRMASSYLVLAQAEAGLHENRAALLHAQLADVDFSRIKVLSPVEQQRALEAHAFRLALEAAQTGASSPSNRTAAR